MNGRQIEMSRGGSSNSLRAPRRHRRSDSETARMDEAMTRENDGSKSESNTQNQDGSFRVAFLALGSIGDCLPLCALASTAVADGTVNSIVTHEYHISCLQALMQNTFIAMEPLPRLCPVDIPVLFGGATSSSNTTATAENYGDGDGDRDEQDALSTELDACMRVLRDIKPKMLVFNLFSAFGYHLADALGIPCLCASPGVPPSGGAVPLERILPWAFLERMDEIDERMGGGKCGSGASGDEVTRADLELWMLPLFHPQYSRWRRARGLLPIVSSSALPRAPPILFGVSPAVLPRPGYWPAKADVCGFWSFPRLSPNYRPPERLARFLSTCAAEGKPVFVVGLGSMPELGLVKNPERIMGIVVSCLRRAGAAVVLLPTGAAAAGAAPVEKAVLDLSGEVFVPHKWLLPRCKGILHHGGAGTTGAALSAGVVQLVIPLAFDQFFFADQVGYIGVGARVEGTRPRSSGRNSPQSLLAPEGDGVTEAAIEQALRLVLSEDCNNAAGRYRDLLADEDGVETACAKISAAVNLHR